MEVQEMISLNMTCLDCQANSSGDYLPPTCPASDVFIDKVSETEEDTPATNNLERHVSGLSSACIGCQANASGDYLTQEPCTCPMSDASVDKVSESEMDTPTTANAKRRLYLDNEPARILRHTTAIDSKGIADKTTGDKAKERGRVGATPDLHTRYMNDYRRATRVLKRTLRMSFRETKRLETLRRRIIVSGKESNVTAPSCMAHAANSALIDEITHLRALVVSKGWMTEEELEIWRKDENINDGTGPSSA